ncbi:MAG: hypothetical protein LBG80_20545 [Bacteroidales bacterium]|jgi:hypothetical protein|nr:hypothetical protein [Bacteroidales bacterium]
MSIRIFNYVNQLRNKALELERRDINNKEATSFLEKYQRRLICIIPSVLLAWFLKEGFPSSFVEYVSNALSILIGLFSTAIIFSFDKFYDKKDLTNASSVEKLIDVQSYNYTKQFTYITGYSIILCLFALVFLSFSSLFSELANINIYNYKLDFHNITIKKIKYFFVIPAVILQRFLVLYWLSSIIYNTLFVIGSLVKYMTLKMDR